MSKPNNINWAEYIKYGLFAKAYRTVKRLCALPLFFTPAWKEVKNFQALMNNNSFGFHRYINYHKYFILYRHIRKLKPNYVLELGSGITTLVIRKALEMNGRGQLVSMDENKDFAESMSEYGVRYSEAIDDEYKGIKGKRYADIPDYPYDYVFVDGPTTPTVDLDTFYVLEKNPQARVIVDIRLNTVRALQSMYNFKYKRFLNLSFNYEV
jgi:hypothetical protein